MTHTRVTAPRPLRAAVAGGGYHGRRWTAALRAHPGVRLLPPPDADDRGTPPAGPRPDFLVDCTARPSVAEAALRRGVSVLSVHPASPALSETAERSGALLMAAQEHCLAPEVRNLGSQAAQLGRLALVSVELAAPLRGPNLQLLDTARQITGTEALSVSCPTPGTTLFQLPDELRLLFTKGTDPGSWRGRWRIIGEQGCGSWDGETADPPGPLAVLEEFLTALRTGRAPRGAAHDQFRSQAMLRAAAEAADTGRLVPILLSSR